jgi:hypothetical protein
METSTIYEVENENKNEIEIEMESPKKSSEDPFCPVLYFGYIMLVFFVLAVLIL